MNATILALVDGEHDACLQELAVRRLAPLAARSASVHALLTRCDVALAAHLRPLDVRCRAIAAVAPDWTTVRDLATLAREVNAGVLYAHGTVAHMICAMAAPLVGIPVVAHLWHAITIGDVHASSLCGSTVVTSTEFGRSQALAVGCKDVAVIPTPARKGPEVCPRSTGPYTFGWAGAWRGHDAGDLFLAAASMVVAARADVRFLVSKPPRNRPAIDGSLAQRAIVVAPAFDAAAGCAEGIDVLVHTSWHDATHVTLVDALARGLRVVATTADGSAELAQPTRRMTLYRAGDLDALAQAMLDAYDDCPQATTVPPPRLPGLDDAAGAILELMDAVETRRLHAAIAEA